MIFISFFPFFSSIGVCAWCGCVCALFCLFTVLLFKRILKHAISVRKLLNCVKELLLYFMLGSNHWWLGNSGVTEEPAQWTDVSHLFGYVKKHHDNKRMFASFLCWLYHYSPQEWVCKYYYREKGFHFRWKCDQENPLSPGCWCGTVTCLCAASFWMWSTGFIFHSFVFSHLWQNRPGLFPCVKNHPITSFFVRIWKPLFSFFLFFFF